MIIVKGITEAKRLLQDFTGETSNNVASSLFIIGTKLVEQMQQDAPVDTGYMRSHIGMTNSTSTSTTNSIQIDSQADYSGFVNFGTIRQSPQPFFTGPIERLNIGTVFTKDALSAWNGAVNKNRY